LGLRILGWVIREEFEGISPHLSDVKTQLESGLILALAEVELDGVQVDEVLA